MDNIVENSKRVWQRAGFRVADWRGSQGIDYTVRGRRVMGSTLYVRHVDAASVVILDAYRELLNVVANQTQFACPVLCVTGATGTMSVVCPDSEFLRLCYDADRVGRDED